MACASAGKSWQTISGIQASRGDLETFVARWPNSVYADSARQAIMEGHWADVRGDSSVSRLESFARDYPRTPYADTAALRIDTLLWRQAVGRNSLRGYAQYSNYARNGAVRRGSGL